MSGSKYKLVKLGRFNTYTEIKDENSAVDAVIIDYDEYLDVLRKYSDSEETVEKLKKYININNSYESKYMDLVAEYNVLVDRFNILRKREEDAKKLCNDLKSKQEYLRSEIEDERNKNRRLFERIKEKSNSERGQTPKKDRSGYIFISCVESKDYIKESKQYVNTYKTKLQTYYPADMNCHDFANTDEFFDEVYKIIDDFNLINCFRIGTIDELISNLELHNDYINKVNRGWDDVIDNSIFAGYEQEFRFNSGRSDKKPYFVDNFAYKMTFSINGREKFWEITIHHTQLLNCVPKEYLKGKIDGEDKDQDKAHNLKD